MNLILPTITTKLINWHMKETSKCGQELYYGSYTKWIPVEPSSLPRRFDHRGKCWSEWKWIIPQDILLTFRYSISIQITCLSILIDNKFCNVEIIHFHSHFPLSIERPNTQWQPKYIVALSILCTLFLATLSTPGRWTHRGGSANNAIKVIYLNAHRAKDHNCIPCTLDKYTRMHSMHSCACPRIVV